MHVYTKDHLRIRKGVAVFRMVNLINNLVSVSVIALFYIMVIHHAIGKL